MVIKGNFFPFLPKIKGEGAIIFGDLMNLEAAKEIIKTWFHLDVGDNTRIELDCPEAAYRFDEGVRGFEDVYGENVSPAICIYTISENGTHANLRIFRSVVEVSGQYDNYIMDAGYVDAALEDRLEHMSPDYDGLSGIPVNQDLRPWINEAYRLLKNL